MKNVTILRLAVGLCALNCLLAFWLSRTLAIARSRIAAGEEATRKTDEVLGQLRMQLTDEVQSRESDVASFRQMTGKAIDTLRDELQLESKARQSEAAAVREMLKTLSPAVEPARKTPSGR